MHYKSLKIEGFRGISKFEITDLKKINVFVGKNNSCKTTVLESFFLISGSSNPQLPVNIHTFRDLVLTSDDDFSYLFHKLDFNSLLKIKATLSNAEQRTLKIKPSYNAEIDNPNKPLAEEDLKSIESNVTSSSYHSVEGITLEFTTGKTPQENTKVLKTEISLRNRKITLLKDYKESLHCAFQNSRTGLVQLDKRLEKIILNKQTDDIVAVLKSIENKITNLTLGTNRMIYADIGLDKFIPINIMGDGIRRILSLIVTAHDTKKGILLIDEIENGLHFSSQKILWKALIEAAIQYDVQLFITTHSYECLRSLMDAFTTDDIIKNEFRLFRLENKNEELKSIRYNWTEFTEALQSNWEVR